MSCRLQKLDDCVGETFDVGAVAVDLRGDSRRQFAGRRIDRHLDASASSVGPQPFGIVAWSEPNSAGRRTLTIDPIISSGVAKRVPHRSARYWPAHHASSWL